MFPGSNILAIPLGYILWFIYRFVGNYFVSIFLFTLVVRAATFPLSLKSQKMQAERARLAPRLERLQKKYAQDKKKLQEKQMALYEKEGVSLTGGCLPMVVQMVVLFGVIAVIYAPLSHLARIPEPVVNASLSAVAQEVTEDGEEIFHPDKLSKSDRERGYYKELRLLMVAGANKQEILHEVGTLSDEVRQNVSAEEYYEKTLYLSKDFRFFGRTLLETPWNADKGFGDVSVLWLIPLFSWLTAMGSSFISMKMMSAGQAEQPAQGCNKVMMLMLMPLFSLFIAFTVPGGVGVYWICSNVIAVIQTVSLNRIYNPAKIRAQAELEYEQRRQKRREDKKRLAEARARENAEYTAAANAAKNQGGAAKPSSKTPPPSKNPNKQRRREQSEDFVPPSKIEGNPEEGSADLTGESNTD